MNTWTLPSKRFGVLEAPSLSSSAGLEGGGVCTREPVGRFVIGAEIDGRLELARLKGRPSSESLSAELPGKLKKKIIITCFSGEYL